MSLKYEPASEPLPPAVKAMRRLPPGGTRIGQAGRGIGRARERERRERETTGYNPFDQARDRQQVTSPSTCVGRPPARLQFPLHRGNFFFFFITPKPRVE